MTSDELDTLHLALPVGSDNGTTVARLSHQLEWHERRVRQGIQELRRERHVAVVALTKPGGVFIATEDDIEALEHTRNSLRSRAMSQLVTVRDLDEILADFRWSPTLFEQTA